MFLAVHCNPTYFMKTIMKAIQRGRREGNYISSAADVALENAQRSK
jgi:hypothetical protein